MQKVNITDDLALAYHILSHLGLDDHTYTHLSARAPVRQTDKREDALFYIYPFGLRFEEASSKTMLLVNAKGEVIEGYEGLPNKTGYLTHGSIYAERPDIGAIFHIHTPEIVAVSAMAKGLQPLSQWALHFYDQIAYLPYDALTLDPQQGQQMVRTLGTKRVMLMRHHGALLCGSTLHEALFYTYHLQQACKTQCLMNHGQGDILPLDPHLCAQTVKELLSFEADLGWRDWQAWKRKLHPETNAA